MTHICRKWLILINKLVNVCNTTKKKDIISNYKLRIEVVLSKMICCRYVPVLAESQLNPLDVSFKADPVRKTLFQGKIFIFLSPKQVSLPCSGD